MQRIIFSCALLLVLSLMSTAARAEQFSGTWSITPGDRAGQVHLRIEYRRTDANGNEEWDESSDVLLSQLHGLSAADVNGTGSHTFSMVRDAGAFNAQGSFSGGHGGGTWTFVPDRNFAGELSKRGAGTPSDKQQFQLAMGGFKLTTLDTLLQNGFQRPNVDDLVRMSEHGVNDEYVNAMKGLRLTPKTVAELIRLRDHGVSVAYAADMLHRAPQLTAEDLVDLRDHGVTTQYMQALAQGGYGNVPPSQAERMMDHGVSSGYLAGLHRLGYHPSPDELVRLVDHGVSVAFIERMRSHGYSRLSVDDLIRLRDHGF
jgi:hypothetical protein